VPSPKLADQPSRVPSPALLPASSSLFATKPLSAEVVHDDADYVTLPRTFSVGKTIQVQERNGEWFRAAILSIEDRLVTNKTGKEKKTPLRLHLLDVCAL